MRTTVLIATMLAGALLGACTAAYSAGGASVGSQSPTSSGASEAPQGQPSTPAVVSTGEVTAVSRSAPSAEAAEAMKLCGVDRYGADRVTGMGQVASAGDVANYVEVYGVEPELKTTSPAWVVTFKGRIDLGRGYWADDPVCVVIDGHPTVFMPHLSGRGDQFYSAPPVRNRPTDQLPPLAP